MKRVTWIFFSASDGHAIGLDSVGRGWELRAGELHRLPDPPAAERRSVGVAPETRPRRSRRKAAR